MKKEKDEKFSFRHQYAMIRKNYERQLKTFEPNFTYDGPAFVLMSEKSEMPYNIEDFKKVLTQFQPDRDLVVLKD